MTETQTEPDLKSTAEKLTDHVKEYVETYIQLTTINVTQKATEAATIGFSAVLVSFFGMIILIFAGLGLAEYFSELMTPKESYLLVALIYTLIGAVFFGFRERLIFPFLRNRIISKMYETKNQNR